MSEQEQETGDEEYTSDQFVQLRDAHKAAKRELKELKAFKDSAEPRLRAVALRDAGFDPDNVEEGPTAALLRLHEGDLTAEALKATAVKYGLATADEGDAGQGAGAPAQLTPEQQQAIASTQRGQQVAGVGAPVTPQPLDAQIAEAVAAGDIKRSLALKNQKLAQLAR